MAQVPYGWRAKAGTPNLWRLGDQAAVIPSLAGEGVGIALASGTAAAHSYLSGESAESFQPTLAHNLARPIGAATLLRNLAERPGLAAPLLRLVHSTPWLLPPLARLTRVA